MNWLQARLREPSTAAGVGTLLLAVSQFAPQWSGYIAGLAGLLGAVAAGTTEKGQAPAPGAPPAPGAAPVILPQQPKQ